MKRYWEIQQKHLITNGHPDKETLENYARSGFILLNVSPATKYHPYAMESDCISFFAKPLIKDEYDKGKNEWNVVNQTHDQGVNA